jgi:serine/threonine protein kinase
VFEDHFEAIRQIGKGGMGTVFLARNKLDKSLYAIKQIPLKESGNFEDVRREIESLSQLSHPFIVRYNNPFLLQHCITIPVTGKPNLTL